MKFSKWMKNRKAEGPAEAMVASKRFAFDLTPKQVALAVIWGSYDLTGDGTDLDALLDGSYDHDTGEWSPAGSAEEVRAFVAKHVTHKWVDDMTKAVLFEVGLGENVYLSIVENRRISETLVDAVAMGLVDAFVDDDTVARLFG